MRSVSAKYKIVRFGEDNSRAFGSYNEDKSPSLRPISMALNAAPETTSCFAASGAPCPWFLFSVSGVNLSLKVSHLNLNPVVLHPVVAESLAGRRGPHWQNRSVHPSHTSPESRGLVTVHPA